MDGIIAITISPGLTRQGILGMGVQLAFFFVFVNRYPWKWFRIHGTLNR